MIKPKKNEVRKPVKSISGVTPIAVMLPPRKCNHPAARCCALPATSLRWAVSPFWLTLRAPSSWP